MSDQLGPRGLELLRTLKKISDKPFETLIQLREKYGDFIQVSIFNRKIVVLSHPDYAKYVYKENYKNYFDRGNDTREIKPVVGDGILLSKYDVWIGQRRILAREFSKESINKYIPVITDFTEEAVDKWLSSKDNSIEMTAALSDLTLRIISKLFLGTSIENGEVFREAISYAGKLAESRIRTGLRVPRSWPLPRHLISNYKIKKMDNIIYEIIDSYKKKDGERDNVLSRIINASEGSENSMKDSLIRDEIATMVVAGHDTTASSITWLIYNLCVHEQWKEIIRDELNEVVGNGPIDGENITNLFKLRAFIKESLRMFPTIANLDRHCSSDDQIGKYTVTKGTTVNTSVYLIHRHPDFWVNPQKFDPERFLTSAGTEKVMDPFVYMPFGAGPRICIGEYLAMVKMQIIVANILRRADFSLVDKSPVKVIPRITIVPENGLEIFIKERKGSG